MASVNFIFSGEVEKYKVELWNYNLDTKIEDIPLNEVYTAVGASSNYNYIVVMPLNSDIVFNNYNTNITYSAPWLPQLNLIDSVKMPGAKLIGLEDSILSNISSNPTTFNFFWLGEVVTATPFNKVYEVDSAALEALSKVDMFSRDGSGNIVTNYTMYITNMLNIGFKLDDGLILGESRIMLGDKDTMIDANLLVGDSLHIDYGSITVPDSETSFDLTSNTFELFLPFIETTITIEPVHCVGRTIDIEIVLDVYTGKVTINLSNDIDGVFTSVSSNIGRNVPIKLLTEINSSITTDSGVSNSLMVAYIKRSRPELVDGKFSNLISKTSQIGMDYKGFVVVDEIDLSGNATSQIKDDIVRLLNRGVIIK